MVQQDRISDAFKGGRADPNRSLEELERFYQQAKWLGECAEYIYPPPIDHSNDAQMTEWEPIWKCFVDQHSAAMIKSTDAKADREKWESALSDFVEQLRGSTTNKVSSARDSYNRLDENGLDAIADKLQSERGKLFPTWRPWSWSSVTEPMRLAAQQYELAHRLWSTRAESRITDYIRRTWAAEDWSEGGKTSVEFNSKNGIEYFIASNDELVVLCFRGTEMNKMGDIITDMRAWQVEVPEKKSKKPMGDDAKNLSSITTGARTKTKSQVPKFHEGFWSALHGVWEQIEKNSVWEAFKSPTKKQVWITGHSLGGALATLAAYRFVRDEVISADQISGVLTFGQPRVGDGEFAGGYSGTRDRHYRFVNNCDIVTMIPPKSIRWLFRAGSIFFKPGSTKQQAGVLAAVAKVTETDAETLKKSYDYADVGNILFLNRASRITSLQPKFWWPFDLFFGRLGSLLQSPFVNTKHRSLMERLVPGVADHSMQEYNRVLKIACAHCAFVRAAIAKMKERPELQSRQESILQKAAEQAWVKLRSAADRVAWDEKQKLAEILSAAKAKLIKLGEKMPQNVSEIEEVKLQVAELDKSKSLVWLDTWHAVLLEQRGQAIEKAVSSLQ